MTAADAFRFETTYADELEGAYAAMTPRTFASPSLLAFNDALAAELGLDVAAARAAAVPAFSGAAVPASASPLAQAYAGHQFGGLSPQLGDGRALLLGELVTPNGARVDVHLKGSGATPFSRGGDGLAAVGPVLREYVMGEAMHALGIPTTRALAAVKTGERIQREGPLDGAILARVAASHLRVGTFVYFAIRDDRAQLERLTRYALARHYPERREDESPALALFEEVMRAQATLIARWMLIGFVHGVMNTDNVTISGETIDYGPCAFMDAHHPSTVFSSIDRHGRYAYGNQPGIGAWNLARFAEALLPLIDPVEEHAVEKAQDVLGRYGEVFDATYRGGLWAKLGLEGEPSRDAEHPDQVLLDGFLGGMAEHRLDHTGTFRDLASWLRGDAPETLAPLGEWLDAWRARVRDTPAAQSARADAMDAINPRYIPRNHRMEEALDAAIAGDLGPFERFLEVLRAPFTKREGLDAYEGPAPESFGRYRTFCGT